MARTFSEYTTPSSGKGGFPIPDFLRDLFNKVFRKEQSLYTRQEEPALMIPEFRTFSYRNVPVQLLSRIIFVYDDPVMPTEIYTMHRTGAEGTLLKVTKVLTNKTLRQLNVKEPPNDDLLSQDAISEGP